MSDIKDKDIDGLLTELNAGKSLIGYGEAQAWNDATDRAIRLVKSYRDGMGLFQDPPSGEDKP